MLNSYGDRFLVRVVEKEVKPGVLLLTREQKEYQIGLVISVGSDLKAEGKPNCPIEVGDYVYTRKYSGLLVEYDGVEYVSLDSSEVLGYSKEIK